MNYISMINNPIQALSELAYCVINSEDRNISGANLDSICSGNINSLIATESGVGWLGKLLFDIVQCMEEETFVYFDKNMHISAEEACEHGYNIFKGLCLRIVDMIYNNPWKYYNSKIKSEYLIYDNKDNLINNVMRLLSCIFDIDRKYPYKSGCNSYFIANRNVEFPKFVKYTHQNIKSNGEILVEECFKHLPAYTIKYNPIKTHLVPGIERSRWDYIVFNKYQLIGFIEIDGEQHYTKNSYFNRIHKKGVEFAWNKRVHIDKCKDEYAIRTSGKKCLRLFWYKKNDFRKCKADIQKWLNTN